MDTIVKSFVFANINAWIQKIKTGIKIVLLYANAIRSLSVSLWILAGCEHQESRTQNKKSRFLHIGSEHHEARPRNESDTVDNYERFRRKSSLPWELPNLLKGRPLVTTERPPAHTQARCRHHHHDLAPSLLISTDSSRTEFKRNQLRHRQAPEANHYDL